MANIFTRIKTIFSSVANNALDSIEDPVLVTRELLRQIDQDITDARGSQFVLKGKIEQLQTKVNAKEAELQKRESQLNQLSSLEDTDQGLIADLTIAISGLKEDLSSMKEQISTFRETDKMTQDMIDQSLKMRDHMQSKMEKLIAENNASKALNKASDVIIKMDNNNTTSEFNRLEQKVQDNLSLAKAKVQTINSQKVNSLDERVKMAISGK